MRKSIVGLALIALFGTACAHSRSPYGTADSSLELERVVLYRNGIGYFERSGNVDDDILRIKVRRDQVNDLLKSLTVIHTGTGKAVSVSMPLDPQSWAGAALASLEPGNGSLAEVLDGLRGTDVVLQTSIGRIRGRIVMVEELINEPDPDDRSRSSTAGSQISTQPSVDHRVTLVEGGQMRVVRLSKVRGITLKDGDLALQLNRRLDASAGEGMFQQIEVAIRLTGAKKHELMVSYVVEAPMWKPTYRVVLPPEGKGTATLQGWAVVDNTSGEDWSDVKLSLTAGEPIAFRYDLHTPRTVGRSDLTESGVRRRATVAMGETTYDLDEEQEEMANEDSIVAQAEPMPAPDDASDSDAPMATKASSGSKNKKPARETRRSARLEDSKDEGGAAFGDAVGGVRGGNAPAAPPPPPAMEPEPEMDYDGLRRSTQASARANKVAGMTRFDLNDRVTVPNGSSTMVAILNTAVEAEETFLFKPGGAGYGYEQNPYRVVRFKNDTEFVLEPGPISIYAGNSFVGEGLSDAVGTKTSATIPFAVEPSIAVTASYNHKGDEMRLVRIVRGVLEVESFARTETTWTARGPHRNDAWSVLVRHPKAGWNYELVDRPEGTEDLPDGYLVRVPIAASKTEGSVLVVEQTPSRTTISIWDGRSIKLLQELLVAADVTPAMRKKLEPVVAVRQEIGRIDTQIEGLKRQQVELDQRADQTRSNLDAIKKDTAASALRKKLSKRLEDFTVEGDALGRKVVELQSARLEKKIELEDLLQNLDVRAPAESAKKKAQPAKQKPQAEE